MGAKKYTKETKFIPEVGRTYIVTDSCGYEDGVSEDYNPYDARRKPHAIELVDSETGTVVFLKSGSLITITKGIV